MSREGARLKHRVKYGALTKHQPIFGWCFVFAAPPPQKWSGGKAARLAASTLYACPKRAERPLVICSNFVA